MTWQLAGGFAVIAVMVVLGIGMLAAPDAWAIWVAERFKPRYVGDKFHRLPIRISGGLMLLLAGLLVWQLVGLHS